MTTSTEQLSTSEDKLKRFFSKLMQETLHHLGDSVEFCLDEQQLSVLIKKDQNCLKKSSIKIAWMEQIDHWLKQHSEKQPVKDGQSKVKILCGDAVYQFLVKRLKENQDSSKLVISKIYKCSPYVEIQDKPANTEIISVNDNFYMPAIDQKVQATLTKPLVMVVEDDSDQRSIIEMVLKDNDYDVAVACDGVEALRLMAKIKPDLIISDLMMPNLDGTELVKRLKSDKRFSSIPILILTVLGDLEKEYALLSLGVDDYCEKTVQRKILLKRIENLLKRSKT